MLRRFDKDDGECQLLFIWMPFARGPPSDVSVDIERMESSEIIVPDPDIRVQDVNAIDRVSPNRKSLELQTVITV